MGDESSDLNGTEPIGTAPIAASDPSTNPGSAVASLWLLISRDNQPPASVPSTEVQICPHCGQVLRNLMQTLGQNICDTCGWSDRPATPSADLTTESQNPPPEDNLKRLLQQAAMQSIDNMNPRKKPQQ